MPSPTSGALRLRLSQCCSSKEEETFYAPRRFFLRGAHRCPSFHRHGLGHTRPLRRCRAFPSWKQRRRARGRLNSFVRRGGQFGQTGAPVAGLPSCARDRHFNELGRCTESDQNPRDRTSTTLADFERHGGSRRFTAGVSITRGYSPVSLCLALFDCASHAERSMISSPRTLVFGGVSGRVS